MIPAASHNYWLLCHSKHLGGEMPNLFFLAQGIPISLSWCFRLEALLLTCCFPKMSYTAVCQSTIFLLIPLSKQCYISFTGVSSALRKSKPCSHTVFHQLNYLNYTGLHGSELLREKPEVKRFLGHLFTSSEKWTPGSQWFPSSFLRQQKPTWESSNTKLKG